jgi:hypothetical protein
MTWHAGPDLLERYAGGALDDVRASSLEAHLLRCERCRGDLATTLTSVDRLRPVPARLDSIWSAIGERLDAPKQSPVERALVRLGVREHAARLLAATPSLQLSWFGAVASALAFAVVAAQVGHRGPIVFLILAPLVPLAGVAVAYGPGVDPTYEIGVAAPMRSHRLLLIRALAVLVASVAAAGLAALTLPSLNWTAVAWLLPALGLSGSGLALSTFWPPLWAAGTVGFAWLACVGLAEAGSAAPLAAFHAPEQLGYLLIAVVSGLVLAARREVFDRRAAP